MVNEFKTYRCKELNYFALANIIIVFLFNINFNNVNFDDTILSFINLLLSYGYLYIIVFIFDSLIPSKLKSIFLLYLNCSKYKFFYLPGSNIFSKLMTTKDYRIDKQLVQTQYKSIYENMPSTQSKRFHYENEQWYKIYRNHHDKEQIKTSLKEYLLCRDLVSLLVLFVVGYFVLSIVGFVILNIQIIVYFVISYVILLLCARNKSNTYAINVIIVDIYDN